MNVLCVWVSDKRRSLAPGPFCVPLPGPHPAPCGRHLQSPKHYSRLTLPPRSRPCVLPVSCCSVSYLSMEGWIIAPLTPSCRRGDRSRLLQIHTAQERTTLPLPNRSCFTPIGLQTQGEEARKAGDQEELRRSRGVLALIASQYGKSFFKLFKKDLHTYACLEGEKK